MVGRDTGCFSPLCDERLPITDESWSFRGQPQVRQALDPPVTTFSGGTSKLVPPQEAVHGEPFAFALRPKLG